MSFTKFAVFSGLHMIARVIEKELKAPGGEDSELASRSTMDLNKLKLHERMGLTLCAYRLDPKISSDMFVSTLDKFEEEVRSDERNRS